MAGETIENAIKSRAAAHAGLHALINGRIYPNVAQQDCTHPYIVYHRIFTERVSALRADTNIVRARFQFDIWGATFESVRNTAQQFRLAFQRWSGTESTIVVNDSEIDDEQDDYDDETKTHRKIFEVILTHRE